MLQGLKARTGRENQVYDKRLYTQGSWLRTN